jgi:hypothetical protein
MNKSVHLHAGIGVQHGSEYAAVSLLVTAILLSYAVFDGRSGDFWPPSIGEK